MKKNSSSALYILFTSLLPVNSMKGPFQATVVPYCEAMKFVLFFFFCTM